MDKTKIVCLLLLGLMALPLGSEAQMPPVGQGSTLKQAIKYYRRMAIKPTSHKKDLQDSQFFLAILDGINTKPVEELVAKEMQNLAVDENCSNCDLFFAAQFSQNKNTVNQGRELFKNLILQGNSVIDARAKPGAQGSVTARERFLFYWERFSNYFHQFAYFHHQTLSQQSYIDAAARLFLSCGIDRAEVKAELEQRWILAGPQALIAGAYFKNIYHSEKKASAIRNQILEVPLKKSIANLMESLLSKKPSDQWPDIQLICNESKHPLVIEFLKKNIVPLTLHRNLLHSGQVYLAAIKSEDHVLYSLARQLIKKRIEKKDLDFNSAMKADAERNKANLMNGIQFLEDDQMDLEMNYGIHASHLKKPTKNWNLMKVYFESRSSEGRRMTRQQEKPESYEYFFYALLKRFSIFDVTLSVPLVVKLYFEAIRNFAPLMPQLESDAHSNVPRQRQIAEELLARLKGPKYLSDLRQRANREIHQMVLQKLKNLSTANFDQGEINFYVNAYTKENVGHKDMHKALKENLWRLEASTNYIDHHLLMTVYLLGPNELKEISLNILRKIAIKSTISNSEGYNQFILTILDLASSQFQLSQELSKKKEIISLVAKGFLPLEPVQKFFEICIPKSCRYPLEFYRDTFEQAYGKEKLKAILPKPTLNNAGLSEVWIDEMIKEYQRAFKESANGKALPLEAKARLRGFDQQLLKNSDEPQVVKFVKRVLPIVTLYPDQWNYRILWLVAAGNEDNSVRELAKHLMRERVVGHDYRFNRGLGKNLKTTEARYSFYFSELGAAALTLASDDSLNDLVQELILNLGLDLKYLRPALEDVLRFNGSENQYKIALKTFFKGFDKNQLSSIFEKSSGNPIDFETKFLVVNGGYSEASNFESNEIFLRSFYYGLFQTKAKVLNAGGPYSKSIALNESSQPLVNDKDFSFVYRDPMTLPDLDESRGFPFRPLSKGQTPYIAATLKNFRQALHDISQENPKRLTVALGGHGSPAGFALWGKSLLDQLTLNDFYRELFEDTMVRTVVSSCFAGSVLASPSRLIPASLWEFNKKYVGHQYPLNKCGLASVNHFQLQYVVNTDMKSDLWFRLFEQVPRPSLEIMRNILYPEGENIPMVTSDYFLEDLRKTFCNEHSFIAKSKSHYGENRETWPKLIKGKFEKSLVVKTNNVDWDTVAANVCSSEVAQKIDSFLARGEEFARLASEISLHERMWTDELIKLEYPEVYKAAEKYRQSNFPEWPQGWEANFFYAPFEVLFRKGWHHTQSQEFYEKRTQEYVQANSKKLKSYWDWLEKNKIQTPYNLSVLESWRRERLAALVLENKALYRQFNLALPELLKPILDNNLFLHTKNIYDSLKKCEASSLN
ncbi:MAG: hypothetical protein SGJ18_09955 [Pseudomonadota bacterium]|nr:hypothetical protein [Pseudomonadota bacterium]